MRLYHLALALLHRRVNRHLHQKVLANQNHFLLQPVCPLQLQSVHPQVFHPRLRLAHLDLPLLALLNLLAPAHHYRLVRHLVRQLVSPPQHLFLHQPRQADLLAQVHQCLLLLANRQVCLPRQVYPHLHHYHQALASLLPLQHQLQSPPLRLRLSQRVRVRVRVLR